MTKPRLTKNSLFFALPLVIQILWDVFILKRPYYLGTGDIVQSYAGLGMSLSDGYAMFGFPAPAGLIQTIVSFAYKFLNVSQESTQALNALFVGLHLLLVGFCSYWVGRSLKNLKLEAFESLLVGAIFAAFPGNFVLSTTLSVYYFVALLSVSAMIVLFERMQVRESSPSDLWGPFFVLGVAGANSYLFFANLVVPSVFIAIILVFFRKTFFSKNAFVKRGSDLKDALSVGALLSFLFLFGTWKWDLRQRYVILIFALITSSSAVLLTRKRDETIMVIRGIVGPFLLGFMLATTSTMRFWLETLEKSGGLYGSGGPGQSLLMARIQNFMGAWPGMNVSGFLSLYPFFAVAVLLLSVPAFVLFRSRDGVVKGAKLWMVGSAMAGGLLAWLTLGPIVLGDQVRTLAYPWRWSLGSRYFMPISVSATLCLVVFLSSVRGRWASGVASFVSLGLFVFGLWHHQGAMASTVKLSNELESRVQEFIRDPQNSLICARVTFPETCSSSYSRGSYYRDGNSVKQNPRSSMLQGRVTEVNDIVLYKCDFKKESLAACFKGKLEINPPKGSKTWIVIEDREPKDRPQGSKLVWSSSELQVAVFEVVN